MKKICLVNVVGLTPQLARRHPSLEKLGMIKPLKGVFPALTCTAQATMVTGTLPKEHGIVANGWYYRDTQEVRFWQQSAQLVQRPTIMEQVDTAQIFCWFAQGGPARWSVVPKPHYGCDGSKAFDILDRTDCDLTQRLGPFPFHHFWGPFSGLGSSTWIAQAAMEVMEQKAPPLTMVYLPHLDYDYQRDVAGSDKALLEVVELLESMHQHCVNTDTEMVVVSEYGLEAVNHPVFLNRALRKEGWLKVRPSPFGEQLLPYDSQAFAVCDHQVAHISVQRGLPLEEVRQRVLALSGVESCEPAAHFHLDHPRSGELIAVCKSGAWFDYSFWLDEKLAPDYAPTIDIHRKPGYDPCELFLKSKSHLAWRMLQKKLGWRVAFDIIDHQPHRVRGSHGRLVGEEHGPVIIGRDTPDRMLDIKPWLENVFS